MKVSVLIFVNVDDGRGCFMSAKSHLHLLPSIATNTLMPKSTFICVSFCFYVTSTPLVLHLQPILHIIFYLTETRKPFKWSQFFLSSFPRQTRFHWIWNETLCRNPKLQQTNWFLSVFHEMNDATSSKFLATVCQILNISKHPQLPSKLCLFVLNARNYPLNGTKSFYIFSTSVPFYEHYQCFFSFFPPTDTIFRLQELACRKIQQISPISKM